MYFRPAEWRKDKTIWLAWPFDQGLWGDDLREAQNEFLALIAALKDEQLVIIFPTKEELEQAAISIPKQTTIALKLLPYGDIWLRDTLPIFVKDGHGKTVSVVPKFNGWGGKYLFDDDADLATRVTGILLVSKAISSLTFEGGSIECDGAGTLLTTEQCLLNNNRNPGVSKQAIEEEFHRLFGAKKVIWLKRGLINDHTDGHIDTLARFIGPQQIALMKPLTKTDPNYEVLMEIKQQLAYETDAHGNKFDLVEVPSPGAVLNVNGDVMPASYVNFLMGDRVLAVPLYGQESDQKAVEILREATPLKVIGLKARAILTGGGAFHCMSQEFYR